MKRKTKLKLPKVRNSLAVAVFNRSGGGVHQKPYKAQRKLDKQKLSKYSYA